MNLKIKILKFLIKVFKISPEILFKDKLFKYEGKDLMCSDFNISEERFTFFSKYQLTYAAIESLKRQALAELIQHISTKQALIVEEKKIKTSLLKAASFSYCFKIVYIKQKN
jgi:hypothetical protein